jgi:protoheme ferro-lyase
MDGQIKKLKTLSQNDREIIDSIPRKELLIPAAKELIDNVSAKDPVAILDLVRDIALLIEAHNIPEDQVYLLAYLSSFMAVMADWISTLNEAENAANDL